jgi:hypothetical protein
MSTRSTWCTWSKILGRINRQQSHHLNNPSRHFIRRLTATINQRLPQRVVSLPDGQTTLPQKILIIQFQFLQACARDLGQLDFHFPAGRGCLGTFRDVLDA